MSPPSTAGPGQDGTPGRFDPARLTSGPLWFGLLLFAVVAVQGSSAWWLPALPVILAAGLGSLGLGLRSAASHPRFQLFLGAFVVLLAGSIMGAVDLSGQVPAALIPALAAVVVLLAAGILRAPAEVEREAPRSDRSSAGLAMAVCTLAASAVASVSLFGTTAEATLIAWLVVLATFSWGWVPVLVPCVLPGTAAALLAAVCWLPLLLWHFGSLWLAAAQGRPLLGFEIMERIREGSASGFVREAVGSYRGLTAAAALLLVFTLARRVRIRHGRAANLRATVQLVVASLTLGAPLIRGQQAPEVTRLAAAPWSGVHPAPIRARPLRLDALADAMARNPAWEHGRPSFWAEWAGRYRGRSVVVVVLESQAATYLPEFGEGSSRRPHTSPELWALRSRGVFFSNYFAGGSATRTALWSLATSLPTFDNSESVPAHSPAAARLGSLARLVSGGYRAEWLCPTSPEFDGWNRLWGSAGARWWIDPAETSDLDRSAWTSWGMPDEQLYEVALQRIHRLEADARPYLLGLLTVSNHPPFRFPAGPGRPEFGADHFGGVGYADFAVKGFVDRLLSMDESRRPLIFITADHGYQFDLTGVPPAGRFNLEATRIPGLLILPDHRGAGMIMDELFAHEDALSLIELLTGPASTPGPFRSGRRVMTSYMGRAAFTAGSMLLDDGRLFRISDRWQLSLIAGPDPDPDRPRLTTLLDWLKETRANLWPPEE